MDLSKSSRKKCCKDYFYGGKSEDFVLFAALVAPAGCLGHLRNLKAAGFAINLLVVSNNFNICGFLLSLMSRAISTNGLLKTL